ncbi:YegP family protein, partial [Vibrio parahaemolyticus]
KADNGQVIATSEMYASKQGAENGIASVKNNADSVTVDES